MEESRDSVLGSFPGDKSSGGSAQGRCFVELRFSKCAGSPSGGGDLPLKSTALPALGTGSLSKWDAGREGGASQTGQKIPVGLAQLTRSWWGSC